MRNIRDSKFQLRHISKSSHVLPRTLIVSIVLIIHDVFNNKIDLIIFQNPLENGGKEEGNSRTKSVETLESDVFHDPKATVLDLFRPTLMLFRSTNMFYQWFSVTMCYYGLSFASVNLLGDPYTNAALSYFIEIPGKYQSTEAKVKYK